MTFTNETADREKVAYHAIFCFTCNEIVPSRAQLKSHVNHDVHYVGKDGAICE